MIVPPRIFQTWKTKHLPPLMARNRELLTRRTPDFEHYLYDDDDCRAFLAQHFRPSVLAAYDKLIPGAYKADLWRYCVLYIYGGIYLDIKMNFEEGFDPQSLLSREHFPLDVPMDPPGVWQGLLVCEKGSLILRAAIERCVRNVQCSYYAPTPLAMTGPVFLHDVIRDVHPELLNEQEITSRKDWSKLEWRVAEHCLEKGGETVCYPYAGYRDELYRGADLPYAVAWKLRRVYR